VSDKFLELSRPQVDLSVNWLSANTTPAYSVTVYDIIICNDGQCSNVAMLYCLLAILLCKSILLCNSW